MFRRNLPKLILCCTAVLWAVFTLLPLKDREFGPYVKESASARPAEFARLMTKVGERTAAARAAGRNLSVYSALKQIGREERLDLSQFFPQIRLESSLKNVEKRNNLVLDELLERSKGRLQLGLDLKGGVAFTLEVDEKAIADIPTDARQEKLAKAVEIIGDRVNGLGVAEPVIRPVGDNRIEVQMPGVSTKDNPEVINVLKKPARLDFRLVMQGTSALSEPPPGEPPPGYEFMSVDDEDARTGATRTAYHVVKRLPEMGGEGVESAHVRMDEFGRFQILLSFNAGGKKRFSDVTTANVGRQLGIVLDGKLYSAPNINEPITTGSAQITGVFSQREAFELANVLNNPLDVPLTVQEQYEVGPTLAGDAVSSARLAFLVGAALTIAFILGFYTVGGVVAAVGMAINVLIVLAVMANLEATLTLPGIAGIVLTLAMSVDANILIFERMKEELKLGKTLPVALEAGFDKAWSAILDGNLTTLITAAIMWWLGTGPVKGFGVTLTIGIFTTMFAAVVVSKLVLELLIHPGIIRRIGMLSVLQDTRIDFLKRAKAAFIASWVIVLIGVGAVAFKGRAVYGIDFTGGDAVSLTFAKRLDADAIRQAAAAAGFEDVTPVYQQQIGSDLELLKLTTSFDRGGPLVEKLQQAFPDAQLKVAGESRLGPAVGEEIQWNALLSLVCALLLILVYVAFRFEFGYGVGAVVCTIHDLLMTVGIFVLFDRQFNASMVAAILLVAGYSINDTIVVFDRIREELKLNPTGTLRDLINRALNLTLSRTLITGGTTLLTALVLIAVTGGEVNDIAFTLFIGVVVGTFSSLFIACPVFYWWHKGDRKHVEAHHDIAPKYEWAGSSRASE